ncbi:hypothetical protein [Paenibacillus sonchi]|uniref:hypothetical protein n=1 Tax=Paenibacillus sonchi TaxID=373687 RepID=UPI001E529833|nr:hypothetical protein [Paenibacillus sonchi]MCE3201002.1 hypothetical protein [Paenibacillus sonchi]
MGEHPSTSHIAILKQKYTELYPQAEALVNAWDPVGLIGGGAPRDEYDCITVQLLELLDQGKNAAEIYQFILQELYEHFGMGLNTVKEENLGPYIRKHKDFSSAIVHWYEELNLTVDLD